MPFFATAIRANDFLNLTFEFFNLKLDKTAGPPSHLTPVEPDKPVHIGVLFPPQHIQERAFFQVADGFEILPGEPGLTEDITSIAKSYLAGWSRLIFKVPVHIIPLEFTLETLLNWSEFELNLVPTALPPPPVKEVRDYSTSSFA
jgi:hypothetical protein